MEKERKTKNQNKQNMLTVKQKDIKHKKEIEVKETNSEKNKKIQKGKDSKSENEINWERGRKRQITLV